MSKIIKFRYKDLQLGPSGELNYGFWGQECGPEFDASPGHVHKYMEDAISVNTCERVYLFECVLCVCKFVNGRFRIKVRVNVLRGASYM